MTAFCTKRYKFSLFGNYNCSFCGGFIVVIITLCCVSWSGNGWKSFRVFYHADILYGACVIPSAISEHTICMSLESLLDPSDLTSITNGLLILMNSLQKHAVEGHAVRTDKLSLPLCKKTSM